MPQNKISMSFYFQSHLFCSFRLTKHPFFILAMIAASMGAPLALCARVLPIRLVAIKIQQRMVESISASNAGSASQSQDTAPVCFNSALIRARLIQMKSSK